MDEAVLLKKKTTIKLQIYEMEFFRSVIKIIWSFRRLFFCNFQIAGRTELSFDLINDLVDLLLLFITRFLALFFSGITVWNDSIGIIG